MLDYEAILFDFDGVLLDSEPIHFACWREVLLPLGIDMDWELYRAHCIGESDRATLEFLSARTEPPVPLERLWAEYERKNRLFLKRVIDNPPIPEANYRLLEKLSSYRLAVVSSSGRAEVEPVLRAANLTSFFPVIVCGDDVNRHKPDPEPYLLAAQRLGVRRALVVEDSDAGEASGRAAGFDVVRVDAAGRTAELVERRLANFR